MVSAESWLRWIPLLPLLGAVLHVAVGYRVGRRATGVLACSVVGVSFLLALRAFSALVSAPEGAVLAEGEQKEGQKQKQKQEEEEEQEGDAGSRQQEEDLD